MYKKDSLEKRKRKGTTANEYRRNEGSQKEGALFRYTIAGGEPAARLAVGRRQRRRATRALFRAAVADHVAQLDSHAEGLARG
jgi:hypothetical protein